MRDPNLALGGRNVYGVPVGMVMTESRFPRVPGDNGNAATWPFPVLYRVVPGASPATVVRALDQGWLDRFLAAARELERAGVALVTTGCGFLVRFQQPIQAALGVPFLSSSLLQVPWLLALLGPDRPVGVLTVERASLTPEHLTSAGIRDSGAIEILGLDEVGGHFADVVLCDRLELDVARARAEHVDAARRLVAHRRDLGAIVLECTNMPPYRDAIREATGLPVFDLTTLVGWAAAAVLPAAWGA